MPHAGEMQHAMQQGLATHASTLTASPTDCAMQLAELGFGSGMRSRCTSMRTRQRGLEQMTRRQGMQTKACTWTSMCRGRSMKRSSSTRSSPKAAAASRRADASAS